MDKRHSIFRDRAITYYMQQQVQDMPVHVIAPPPVAIFVWILCGLMLVAGLVGWLGTIPVYLSETGLLLAKGPGAISSKNETTVLILMPTSSFTLRSGMPVHLHLRSAKVSIESKIETVEPLTHRTALHQQYGLPSSPASLLTRPSIIITAKVTPALLKNAYTGEAVDAQVKCKNSI